MRGLQWTTCLVYLDDIVVFSRDFDSHMVRLSEVLSRLEDAGLKVKASKCCLARREVAFLGHVVGPSGVATDPEKIRSVQDWSTPTTLTEMRSFLGLAGYYRSFVPQFASIAKPLTSLADKGPAFDWNCACEAAFTRLKHLLTCAPILGYPQEEGRLTLDTDASDMGLGAVLSQDQDGVERVLSYSSRTLTKPERNYCVTRRELLAIIFGLKKFRHYLLGRRVLIRTDHAALKWVMHFKDPEGQVARWIQIMDTFDYEVQHRPGKLHGNADGLSRVPCRQCGHGEGEDSLHCRVMTTRQSQESMKGESAAAISSPAAGRAGVDVGDASETDSTAADPPDPDEGGSVGEEWSTAQKEDEVMGRVYEWVTTGTTPTSEEIGGATPELRTLVAQLGRLRVKEEIMGRWWHTPGGTQQFQILVPLSKRKEILASVHGDGMAGHLGRTRSLRRCQERFYWPDFRRDVTYWCATCMACLKRKSPPAPHRAKMGHVKVGLPMERMALDIIGPLPRSNEGFKYILVIVDYFTKWAEAVPLRDQEASSVARAFVETAVLRFGTPATLNSDQGTNFQSKIFKETLALLDIEQTLQPHDRSPAGIGGQCRPDGLVATATVCNGSI